MQHNAKSDYTNRYDTKRYNTDSSLPLTKGECPEGARGSEHECFICGRKPSKTISLRLIRRWKTVSRAVILIVDHVCSICDDKHKLISSKPNDKR